MNGLMEQAKDPYCTAHRVRPRCSLFKGYQHKEQSGFWRFRALKDLRGYQRSQAMTAWNQFQFSPMHRRSSTIASEPRLILSQHSMKYWSPAIALAPGETIEMRLISIARFLNFCSCSNSNCYQLELYPLYKKHFCQTQYLSVCSVLTSQR